jgi:hypothetical protein
MMRQISRNPWSEALSTDEERDAGEYAKQRSDLQERQLGLHAHLLWRHWRQTITCWIRPLQFEIRIRNLPNSKSSQQTLQPVAGTLFQITCEDSFTVADEGILMAVQQKLAEIHRHGGCNMTPNQLSHSLLGVREHSRLDNLLLPHSHRL